MSSGRQQQPSKGAHQGCSRQEPASRWPAMVYNYNNPLGRAMRDCADSVSRLLKLSLAMERFCWGRWPAGATCLRTSQAQRFGVPVHACVQLCPPRPRGLCKHTCTQQNTVTPKPQTRPCAAALFQCNLFPWKTCQSHMNTACATEQPGLSSQAASVPRFSKPARSASQPS